MSLDLFCITAALMVGTAGLPHVIVRFFTVKNVKAVRKSAYWTLGFIAIIYLTAPALGMFARTNFIEEINEKKYQEAPQWFKNWEKQGMIAWVDKNKDGIMQYRAGDVFAGKPEFDDSLRTENGPRPVTNKSDESSTNEVYYDKDIIVLANPEMAKLPKWIIALVMAGCVAAAHSTAAGLLLVLSTSVSHDLMKKIIKPDISDKMEIRYARLASLGAVLVAAYFGINPPSSFVAKTVAFAFGLAASSFFSHLDHGNFLKKSKQTGGHSGNDHRNRIHFGLHRLFSISYRQQRLLVRYFARRNWFRRHADQLLRRLRREQPHASSSSRCPGDGREHSHTQRGGPSVGALIS